MAEEKKDKTPEKKISLQAFLTTKPLTRAEITYYTRHFGTDIYQELTIAEWSKKTGLA